MSRSDSVGLVLPRNGRLRFSGESTTDTEGSTRTGEERRSSGEKSTGI
jgi:hypothetical protein